MEEQLLNSVIFDDLIFMETVGEFNEHHDKAGRFATGDGDGITDLSDVTEEEWNNGYADRTFGTANLSRDVLSEADSYFDMGFTSVNGKLREYKGNVNAVPDSYFPGIVKSLDTATGAHTLSKDYTMYRGTSVDPALMKVGTKIKDFGYSSASFSKHRAIEFTSTIRNNVQPVLLKITAPKGTRGFIPAASNMKMVIKGEAEFLFKRGTTFTITKMASKDGYIQLEVSI